MWVKLPDQVAPCKGCTDRTIEPNCHMTCERYLSFRGDLDKKKQQKRRKDDIERPIRRYRK